MDNRYDVICIGAGSGGLAVGLAAHELGLRVLIVEQDEQNFGGDCLNNGCIPSKALLHASKSQKTFKEAIAYVKRQQEKLRAIESVEHMRKKGVDIVIGKAVFKSKKTIEVAGDIFEGRKIVVAIGTKPREVSLKNHGQIPIVTNEGIFDIKDPKHLAIIGGGPIGCEMAQAFCNLGIKVTIFERGPRLLANDELFASNLIAKKLKDSGVTVCLNCEVEQIDYANRLRMTVSNSETNTQNLSQPASHVLLAIGRIYDYSQLNLTSAEVELYDNGKPVLGIYNQSQSNSAVVFTGDAAGGPLFSHMSEEHARVLLNRWLNPFSGLRPRVDMVPWVTFTDYQVAKFGVSADYLKSRSLSYRVLEGNYADDDRAYTDDYRDASYKIYLSKNWFGREYIAGGTVVAPDASEMVQELILMSEQKLPLSVLRNKFYAFPTKSRFWQRVLLEDQKDRSLNLKTKKALRFVFRLFN